MIPSPIVTGANLLHSKASVSAAQLYALEAQPVEMAPGIPGKILLVIAVSLRYFYGGVPFEFATSAEASLKYGMSGMDAISGQDIGISIVSGATANALQLNLNSIAQIIPLDNTSIGQPVNLYALDPGFVVGPIAIIVPDPGNTGTGYAPGDTGLIAQGSNVTGQYEIDTVDGGGGVLTLHLTAAGSGYVPATGVTTQVTTGSGDGTLLVDITVTQVTTGNGSLEIEVLYQPV
jgi:hypothetical protein